MFCFVERGFEAPKYYFAMVVLSVFLLEEDANLVIGLENAIMRLLIYRGESVVI